MTFLRPYVEDKTLNYGATIEVDYAIAMVLLKLALDIPIYTLPTFIVLDKIWFRSIFLFVPKDLAYPKIHMLSFYQCSSR